MPRDSREPITEQQRKDILNRDLPILIKKFNGHTCAFSDEGLECPECPLSHNLGAHCRLRSVMAVLIDDKRRLTPYAIAIEDDKPKKPKEPFNRFADLD